MGREQPRKIETRKKVRLLQEIISLSFGDGLLQALQDLEHVFPDFAFL